MIIECQNQTLELLPERALFWQEQRLLVVADIHLGKVAHLQKAGFPVPEGGMQADLTALGKLVALKNPTRCVVVGDLIHAKGGLSPQTIELFAHWMGSHRCEIDLVFGNHDKALIKHLPATWNLKTYYDELLLPPFCFRHHPHFHSSYYTLSGHLHPQVLLKSGPDQLTFRCFQFTPQLAILPAFSSCVGGAYIKKSPHSRVFITTGQEVVEL